MQSSHATLVPPGRLIDRLRTAPLQFRDGLLPALKSYRPLRLGGGRDAASPVLRRIGSLEVRLATTASEVRRAQRLRYRVFYEEGCAAADAMTRLLRRDTDSFDAICDHLLVIDHESRDRKGRPSVVGTYRLLPQAVAESHDGFYTSREFDIDDLTGRHRGLRFLELGRSCVLSAYRNKRTVELLWHGCWAYVRRHGLDVMFGCASFEGTDPDALALPLSYLHHYASAPEAWQTRAVGERYVGMNRMPKEAIDPRVALRMLPPLVKGYLRLGASIGDGAVIDRQFGTTDVLIILPVAAISARYIEHFAASGERHAA